MAMAIMDMVMAEKTNKLSIQAFLYGATLLLFSGTSISADWDFTPNVGVTETYTDNIELSQIETQSSLVSQFILGAEAEFTSKKLQFSFSGTETLARYSHDSEINDDFQTLQSNFVYDLWDNKLYLVANTSIDNISRDESENSLADLITGDTIQQISNSGGLQFNSGNSNYSFSSSLTYSKIQTEDDIGESEGYTATVNSENGNAARHVFWQINGSFLNRENNGFTSENYQVESKLGAITTYKINPFIRIYNERVTGTAAGNNADAIPSWGPGLRYQAAQHFIIDLSYNYVNDDTEASDDYVAADINWQPSSRTSLQASYSKRFFGDSYELDFSHRTKRLTNSISYHETIEVFDRNNYLITENEIWCPNTALNIDECLPLGETPTETNDYQSFPISVLDIEENNEFSLNKRLSWQSSLALSRTTFTIDLSTREREALSSGTIDDYADARFTVTRRITSRSDFTAFVSYSKNVFDKDNPDGARQKDIYKTFSATYNRSLASSLNAFFTLQYIDRQSNIEHYIYNEARAAINLTKDF